MFNKSERENYFFCLALSLFVFFGHFSLFSESKRPRKALVFRIGEL